MSALVGTGSLVRLALRLDRAKLAAWILVLIGVTAVTAVGFEGLYPTVAERQEFGLTISTNPAFQALLGPLFDASTIGGLTAWRIGGVAGVLAGLMGMQTVVRHTRAEEEAGRLELVGAGIVGRHAPLAAALLVAFGAGLALVILPAAVLIALGQPAAGSIAFGLGLGGAAWMFAAVGAVTAQLTTSARTANGIAGVVLGAAYLLRAVGDAAGDSGPSWASWLSPIGWTQQLRPFADERWWVLGLMAAFVACTLALAHAMVVRRDVDAGMLPTRPGPARGAPSLRTALALAWRLQRGPLLGWTVGIAVVGAVIGSVGQSVGDLLSENEQLAQIFAQLGGEQTIVDAYLAATLGIMGIVTSIYVVQAALRLRTEETGLRAEPVLAADVQRRAWAASHLTFAIGGPVVLLAAGGLAMGLVHGALSGDIARQVPRMLGGALVQLPATWVLAGVTLALFGLLPRYTSAAWGVLVTCLLLGQLGQVLELDQWLLDLSPFTHVPQIPGSELVWAPLLWLTAVAAALVAVGLMGFRRRDIG